MSFPRALSLALLGVVVVALVVLAVHDGMLSAGTSFSTKLRLTLDDRRNDTPGSRRRSLKKKNCVDDEKETFKPKGYPERVTCEEFSRLDRSVLAETCQTKPWVRHFCPVACHLCLDDSLGRWGDVFDMEVIPIHANILPDGNVLSFGASEELTVPIRGYEVWDTETGDHMLGENHEYMTQDTGVNIFCTTMSTDVSTGNIMLMGGTDNVTNDCRGVNDVLEFNIQTQKIETHPLGPMQFSRWYGSSINLPDGRIFICGGMSNILGLASSVPELFDPVTGWKSLWGANIPAMKDRLAVVREGQAAWWYPYLYVNSKAEIFLMIADAFNSDAYKVSVQGFGRIEKVAKRPFPSHKLGPSLMYDVDQVLVLDGDGWLWTIDISDASNPIFTKKVDLGKRRVNSVMTFLPDGRVAINGGSDEVDGLLTGSSDLSLSLAVKGIQIWDPISNTVFDGPEQALGRLYHSSGLTLTDGSLFSAGGGAPGPIQNANGQIYYPSYLFDPDSPNGWAARPTIESWPKTMLAGKAYRITVANNPADIVKVTATKPGSMTHARNCDGRWLNLDFKVVDGGTAIKVWLPGPNVAIVGLWYINVIDSNGVPSPARIFDVPLP